MVLMDHEVRIMVVDHERMIMVLMDDEVWIMVVIVMIIMMTMR